jgi:Tol biopolymer transport system component
VKSSQTNRSRRSRSGGAPAQGTSHGEAANRPALRQWRKKAAIALAAGYALIAAWYIWARRSPNHSPAEGAALVQLTSRSGQELFPALSPDGKLLAYCAKGHIFLEKIEDKTETDLTPDSTSQNWQPEFSPEGARIAFRSEREGGGIFAMPAAGGPAVKLTEFGYNPVWSPDGKQIACATETFLDPSSRSTAGSSLWIIDVGTGNKRPLTSPQGIPDAIEPNWSPHGDRIAYWSMQSGHAGIWTVSAAGANPIPVTQDASTNWNPVWSADGRYIYFTSDRSSEMELWRVRIEEKSGKVMGEPAPIIREPGFSGFISFSRDGRRMAFIKSARSANLFTVAFDARHERTTGRPAAVTQGTRLVFGPDLSPDGRWFAFFSWGQRANIFVAGIHRETPRPLTNDAYQNRWPRWSPDGKRIAFHSNRSGSDQIWTVYADGSELQQITDSPEPAIFPVWSPDGKFLAYSSVTSSFILDATKSWNEQRPTALPAWSEPPGSFQAFSWSPDGRKLAGHLQSAGSASDTAGIVTYSVADRKYQRLTNAGSFPVWLSDSRRLLYAHGDKIVLTDTETGDVHEVLTTAPPVLFGISRDDRLLYFTRVQVEADIWLSTLK